ncbi:hypothetical protein ABT186_13060 [Streptomyces sp. NPDC001634]|uniref:hypothetical protein n=1 Tax=Streptomyces sp. NPDC001634 TaxID=3154390 RepID=UPI00331D8418
MVDIMALAGMALFMFLAGMSHSEPSSRPSTGHGVPLLVFALFWVVPGALGVSAFVQARLSMPISATVQGLFFVVGVVLGFGATRMLLSFA